MNLIPGNLYRVKRKGTFLDLEIKINDIVLFLEKEMIRLDNRISNDCYLTFLFGKKTIYTIFSTFNKGEEYRNYDEIEEYFEEL